MQILSREWGLEENPQLELVVKVINLNSKENDKLLDECPILKEYTEFVRIVKEYRAKYGKEEYDKASGEFCLKANSRIGIGG